ncbi:MAG: endonuclease domain-containing protein [Gemmataceae bacterium]
MKPYQVVVGQFVREEKADLARSFRREMTPAERILWQALRGRRLRAKFRRQQVIDGFIADFYCHEAALVLETDGPVHERQRGDDEERDGVIASRGLTVLRVTNAEVMTDLAGVLRRVESHLTPRPPLRSGEGEAQERR